MSLPLAPGAIIRAADLGLLLDARQVLEAARGEADEIRDAARAEGLRAGRADGSAAATRLLAEAAATLRRGLAEAEPRLAEAIALAVERILGARPAPQTVAAAAAEAVRQLARGGEITVRVAEPSLDATRAALADADGVTVQADAALGVQDCVVTAEFGHVEAGLPAQLRALRRGLGLPEGAA